MSKLELITWSVVKASGPPPKCSVQKSSAELEALITEHVQSLSERASSGATPAAEFVNDAARSRFESLAKGSEKEFVSTATDLAGELQSRMDQRTSEGVLVAARLSGPDRIGIFKLDITDKYAGFLGSTPSGQQMLNAIKNLLETPGKLQKGAITPDARPDSEVVVGDKLPTTSQYFLDALGIRQSERGSLAIAPLIKTFVEVTGRPAESAIRVLQKTAPSKPRDFVNGLPIAPAERQEILDRIDARRRPIRTIDSRKAKAIRKVIKADGITISGSLADMANVTPRRRNDDRWEVTIVTDQPPTESYE